MKGKTMKLTTKVMAAIMIASTLVSGASPALVRADDSVAIVENVESGSGMVEESVEATVEEMVTTSTTVTPATEDVTNKATETPAAEEVTNKATETSAAEEVTNKAAETPATEDVVNKATEEASNKATEASATVEEAAKSSVAEETVTTSVVEEVVVNAADEEEVVAKETADTSVKTADGRVVPVRLVDNGYEVTKVDPEVERAVAEVEENMKNAVSVDNQDTASFGRCTDQFGFGGLGGLLAAGPGRRSASTTPTPSPTPEPTTDELLNKRLKADEKSSKKADKKKLAEQINQAGTVAANYAVDLMKIDYDDPDVAKNVAKLTVKTINESVITQIPYVGGLISTFVGLIYQDGEPEVVEQPSEETLELREVNRNLITLNDTVIKAASDIINEGKIRDYKDAFNKMGEKTQALTREYNRKNGGFISAMQLLHKYVDNPPVEEVGAAFKKIYDVESENYTYLETFNDFAAALTDNGNLLPSVSSYDVFVTYDKINTTRVCKGNAGDNNIKYLFNEEREALTDKVENIVEVGYGTLRYCMEVNLAEQRNMLKLYEKKWMDLDGMEAMRNPLAGEKLVLKNKGNELKAKQDAILANWNRYSEEEKQEKNKEMEALNAEITSINKEIAIINEKCNDCSSKIGQYSIAVSTIESQISDLNLRKGKVDEVILRQRKSICDGYDFLVNAKDPEKVLPEKIKVYMEDIEAKEYLHNGKYVKAYPTFTHGDSKIDYVDIFGNVWATQEVTYNNIIKGEDYWWQDHAYIGGKFLFGVNGAAAKICKKLCGEVPVLVIDHGTDRLTRPIVIQLADGSYTYIDSHSIGTMRTYKIGEIKDKI